MTGQPHMEENDHLQGKRDPSFLNGTLIPWTICLLAVIFYFYDFFLRVTPSVMIEPLMKQYSVGATEIGFISAFYYYAYTPLQIPSGIIVDKYSIKWTLTLSALLCAVGTLIFAAFLNITAAFIGRAFMGIGSAFAFIGALKLAALWLPKKYFAFFSGLATSFGVIGAVSADTVLSRMVVKIGWRDSVYITAIAGFVIAVLIFLVVRDRPAWIVRMPRSYHSWGRTSKRLLNILKMWRFWINGIVGAFLFTPVSVFASLWGVAFLIHSYHLPAAEGATAASLVFIGAAVGSPVAGWFSDVIRSRRLPLFIGTIATTALSAILIYVGSFSAVTVLVLLFFLGVFAGPEVLVFAIAREISPPRSTGISTATTNFIVTLSAAIFQPLIGYLLTLHWTGTKTAEGTPYYTTHDYRFALLIIPVALFIAFLLTFALPRTRCRNIYKDPIQFQGDETDEESQ